MAAPEGPWSDAVTTPFLAVVLGPKIGPSSLNKNYLHYDLQWSSVEIFGLDRGDERHSSNTPYPSPTILSTILTPCSTPWLQPLSHTVCSL